MMNVELVDLMTRSMLAPAVGPKYQQVASMLREQILSGDLSVGEKLPPMTSLASRHEVSLATIFRAVQVINQEGLVSGSGGRGGTVVQRRQPVASLSRTMMAGIFRPPRARRQTDNFALDIIEGLREEISQLGFRLLYHGLDEGEYAQRILELVDSGQTCGCLIDQKTPLSLIKRLAASQVPCVLFNRYEQVDGLSCVWPDYADIGRESARKLHQRGYQRLGFYKTFTAGEETAELDLAAIWPVLAMQQGFVEEAQRLGYHDEDLLLLREPDHRDQQYAPATFGLVSSRTRGWRSLGVLTFSDTYAIKMQKAIKQTDLRLGQDAGVISGLSLDISREAEQPPSSWHISPQLIGKEAVKELHARLQDNAQQARLVKLPATFNDCHTA